MSTRKLEPAALKRIAAGRDLTTPLNPSAKQKEMLLRRESADGSSTDG